MSESKQVIKNKVGFLDIKIPPYASVLGITVLLLLWETICRMNLVPPLFLPAPTAILSDGWELMISGELLKHITASLSRIVGGYAIGATVGIIVGLILGFSRWADAIFTPVVYSIYPIPKIALLPLIILWLGIGEMPKVAIIALGVFFPVLINTFSGVKSVDQILIKAAVTFGCKSFQCHSKGNFTWSLTNDFCWIKIISWYCAFAISICRDDCCSIRNRRDGTSLWKLNDNDEINVWCNDTFVTRFTI